MKNPSDLSSESNTLHQESSSNELTLNVKSVEAYSTLSLILMLPSGTVQGVCSSSAVSLPKYYSSCSVGSAVKAPNKVQIRIRQNNTDLEQPHCKKVIICFCAGVTLPALLVRRRGSGSDMNVFSRASSLLPPASCRRLRSLSAAGSGGNSCFGDEGREEFKSSSMGMGEREGRTLAGSREAEAGSGSSLLPLRSLAAGSDSCSFSRHLRSCSSFKTSSMAGVWLGPSPQYWAPLKKK